MPKQVKPQQEPQESLEIQEPLEENSQKESQQSPDNKYAPRPRIRPTIGRDQIGGPKQRVTPKFNSVSTTLY